MRSRITFILFILFVGVGLFTSCKIENAKEEVVYYTCPMHPEIREDEPGKCTICKMDLVKEQ